MDLGSTSSIGFRGESVSFWNRFLQGAASYSRELDENLERALASARNFFHCEQGCKVLDIGCGRGVTTISGPVLARRLLRLITRRPRSRSF